MFDAAVEKVRTSKLTFAELEPFRLFPWLLEGEMKNTSDGWLAALIGGATNIDEGSGAKQKAALKKKAKLEVEAEIAKKAKLKQLFK